MWPFFNLHTNPLSGLGLRHHTFGLSAMQTGISQMTTATFPIKYLANNLEYHLRSAASKMLPAASQQESTHYGSALVALRAHVLSSPPDQVLRELHSSSDY